MLLKLHCIHSSLPSCPRWQGLNQLGTLSLSQRVAKKTVVGTFSTVSHGVASRRKLKTGWSWVLDPGALIWDVGLLTSVLSAGPHTCLLVDDDKSANDCLRCLLRCSSTWLWVSTLEMLAFEGFVVNCLLIIFVLAWLSKGVSFQPLSSVKSGWRD